MKVRECLVKSRSLLAAAAISEADREARLICAFVLTVPLNQLFLHLETDLTAKQKQQVFALVQKRSQAHPLQYLLGEQEFMSLDFMVDPNVLIPRWDSERVVEAALAAVKNKDKLLIADICCGSGALGLSLAYYLPQAEVFLSDISQKALTVASKNAHRLQVFERCHFLQGDLLEPFLAQKRQFDLVITNPPYIRTQELSTLPPDVQKEPLLALDGGQDGLAFYRRLLKGLPQVLARKGFLVMETGFDQKAEISELLLQSKFHVLQYIDDFSGNHRGVVSQMGDKEFVL